MEGEGDAEGLEEVEVEWLGLPTPGKKIDLRGQGWQGAQGTPKDTHTRA